MNKASITRLIKQTGLQPSRNAGQHFLMDETVVERMAEAANVQAGDAVLEIGPGFGMLTRVLLKRGANVIAVELDRRLAAYLRQEFAGEQNFTLVEGDIFRIRLDQILTDRSYKLVANLPYSATSLVFRQFLTQSPRPSLFCVLIQKEVAERIIAAPGQLSLLALSVQYFGSPAVLFEVPPTVFVPPPRVTSAVLKIDQLRAGDPSLSKELFRLAKMGFAGKRKQLQNSLAAGLRLKPTEVADWLLSLGMAPEARPQELSVENWLELAKNPLKAS